MRAFALAAVLALLSASAFGATIEPRDAASHIGETVTIEGAVGDVFTDPRSRATFLDFGASYPDMDFTAVIFVDNAAEFPGVASLNGRTVDVTGVVHLYRNKPEIILNDARQLRAK